MITKPKMTSNKTPTGKTKEISMKEPEQELKHFTQNKKVSSDNQTENDENDDDTMMIDLEPIDSLVGSSSNNTIESIGGKPSLNFGPIQEQTNSKGLTQTVRVTISPHRLSPLKKSWPQIYTPIVEELKLLIKMNLKTKKIELKTSKHTLKPISSTLTKAINFLQCFNLGFQVEDSLSLLRLENDIFIESFEIKDVKNLSGDHLSRAIGRISGKDGKTKFTIENCSRTRIVLADTKIHILGSFAAIRIARDSICALILGSPPGKVYHGLRTVAARQRERF